MCTILLICALKFRDRPAQLSPDPPPCVQLGRISQLRSLDLKQGYGGVIESHAAALGRLSTLTALTSLQLRVLKDQTEVRI